MFRTCQPKVLKDKKNWCDHSTGVNPAALQGFDTSLFSNVCQMGQVATSDSGVQVVTADTA